jgi:cytochrome c oxidase subunit IV
MDVHFSDVVSFERKSQVVIQETPMHVSTELEPNHPVGTAKLFSIVWVWLLLLTGFEIFLAYERVEVHIMITILVGLSLIKSALIMAYFMHLRFEKLGLFLIIVPAMVFCICMMMIMFFPDSLRLTHLPRL